MILIFLLDSTALYSYVSLFIKHLLVFTMFQALCVSHEDTLLSLKEACCGQHC